MHNRYATPKRRATGVDERRQSAVSIQFFLEIEKCRQNSSPSFHTTAAVVKTCFEIIPNVFTNAPAVTSELVWDPEVLLYQ